MGEPAFVAMGDIHLDPFIWRKYRQVVGDSFIGFGSVVDLAISRTLPLLLLGDLFDTVKPTPACMRFFRKEMDRCQAAGVSVYAIQGNHDKQEVPWYVAAHDHVQHIGDGQPVEIGILRCVGFDYALKDHIQSRLVELSAEQVKPDCLFLHQGVRQAMRLDEVWDCDLDWVPEGIPLTVMGHIHKEWETEIREGQRGCYTCSTHARNISEVGPKTALIVNDDLTYERVPIAYRDIRKFRISAVDHVREMAQWLDDVLRRESPLHPLAWVVFTPEVAAEVGRLTNDYIEQVLFIQERVASPEELELDLEEESPEETDELISVETLLAKLVDPGQEPRAYQLILDLLQDGNSILDVIRDHRELFLSKEQDT